MSQKFLDKIKLTTPSYPPPSRGRNLLALQIIPLPWWEGQGEGDITDYGNLFMGHETIKVVLNALPKRGRNEDPGKGLEVW